MVKRLEDRVQEVRLSGLQRDAPTHVSCKVDNIVGRHGFPFHGFLRLLPCYPILESLEFILGWTSSEV